MTQVVTVMRLIHTFEQRDLLLLKQKRSAADSAFHSLRNSHPQEKMKV